MKKILIIILILGLVGVMGLLNINMKNVKAEEYQIEELINQVFKERVNLLSSKDLEEFDSKLENVKNSLSFYFTNSSLLDDSLNELREIYGMAEGYGKFEIVSIVPLIRIYRIDIRDYFAISYVQQFILYRVKSKFAENINNKIPEEWIAPTDENGCWRAATSDYYTILLRKDLDQWKIVELTRGDSKNETILKGSSPIFVESSIKYFSPPPKEIMPLPYYIENELNIFSFIAIPQNYPSWMYREQAASYADRWWNKRNTPKYPSYSSDCANFVSQCLYDEVGGRFRMDWNNNGIIEQPFSNPPLLQEWHINLYSNYNPSYSWTWNPCQDYYAIYNIEGSQHGFVYRYLTIYRNLSIGDIVNLDQNNNQIPDHVGIVVSFSSDGTPLIDAHTSDRWHVSWENLSLLYHCIHLDYEYGFHY